MDRVALPASVKCLSALRRIGDLAQARWSPISGPEGCAGVFVLPEGASPVIVEAVSGRSMTLAPGDIFLATPGYRESVRWSVGGIPDGGLIPDESYWILSESGVMGVLQDTSARPQGHLGQARYLGALAAADGHVANLRDVSLVPSLEAHDAGAPVYLLVGTSSEIGKTTAGLVVLRTLMAKGRGRVAVLKATGTCSVTELFAYRDFGAAYAFDFVDFGVPATFPSGREDAGEFHNRALDVCLSLDVDAVLIECGGDLLGTCIPEFLRCLLWRRPHPHTILAAADPSGALGAKQFLRQSGIELSLITGPCTDTIASRRRTEAICETPVKNLRMFP